eukprot:scaffold5060_cov123-Isochrysis_galbana.AAC.5
MAELIYWRMGRLCRATAPPWAEDVEESCTVCGRVLSAPEESAVIVEGGACSFELVVSGSRLSREGVV